MGRIFLISDLHFCHDREFIYGPRNFNSVQEMNEAIIANWNNIVEEDDEVYILGDLMLKDNIFGCKCFNQLKGKKHIILGNHDSNERQKLYQELRGVVDMKWADMLNYTHPSYGKFHFYISHFPAMTGNLEKESLNKTTCNLFGHTHSKKKFYNDIPYMYNVACDAHNCTPVLLDDIIEDMVEEAKKCKEML